MADKANTAAGKILHNSFWFGLETVLETIVFLGTSIAVARYLGPEKLGEFTYINFFVTTVTRTSGTGLAGATRKYMSEFLGLGRPGTARAVGWWKNGRRGSRRVVFSAHSPISACLEMTAVNTAPVRPPARLRRAATSAPSSRPSRRPTRR